LHLCQLESISTSETSNVIMVRSITSHEMYSLDSKYYITEKFLEKSAILFADVILPHIVCRRCKCVFPIALPAAYTSVKSVNSQYSYLLG